MIQDDRLISPKSLTVAECDAAMLVAKPGQLIVYASRAKKMSDLMRWAINQSNGIPHLVRHSNGELLYVVIKTEKPVTRPFWADWFGVSAGPARAVV